MMIYMYFPRRVKLNIALEREKHNREKQIIREEQIAKDNVVTTTKLGKKCVLVLKESFMVVRGLRKRILYLWKKNKLKRISKKKLKRREHN